MSFSEFKEDFWNDRASQIQLGMIGEIQKFDKQKMRADVKPLLKLKNAIGEETEYPILADLPVNYYNGGGFYIRPEYQTGDLVWLGFSTYDIQEQLNGYTRVQSDKIFGIENAVVIGSIAKNNSTMPTEFNSEDGLIIGSDTGNAYMVIKKDSIVFNLGNGAEEIEFSSTGIKTKQDIEAGLNIKAGLEVSANNKSVQTTLSKHVHTGNLGAPTSTPTPGT